jgi:integrase
MASTWIFQELADVNKLGDKAPWQVSWYEPDGRRKKKSFGPGYLGKKHAERFRSKIESELMTGTYQMEVKKTWEDFYREYDQKILSLAAPRTRDEARTALAHFQRIVKPLRILAINSHHIDDYIAKRSAEPGKKRGDVVSPAIVNKELRHIKAALRKAKRWKYLKEVPDFTVQKLPRELPTYVTAEHFTLIYQACDRARLPRNLPERLTTAAAWWRALLVMGYMTGWRISDMLGLRRDDVDLEAGTAITRWEDNKGNRDDLVQLHPVVVEHLAKIQGFDSHVFPWNLNRTTLMAEFAKIQEAAGIHLPCRGKHTHTRFCHVYGFHDLRRAFATMNADKLTPNALQALMRHKSYQTT